MSEITIPYHLAIPSVLCIIGLLIIFTRRKLLFTGGKRTVIWLSVTAFLISYFFIVGIATYYDLYYQWDLNRYDLDKDGFFGGKEITKEQQIAMQHLTNDVGRNLAFITGLIYSFIISATVYLVGRILNLRKTTRVSKNLR